jgi:hypothetical protein
MLEEQRKHAKDRRDDDHAVVPLGEPTNAYDDSRRLEVTVDTRDAADVAEWAPKSRSLVEEWHPKVAEMLKGDGFTPPRQVRLVFKDQTDGIAGTSGDKNTINANWIRSRPSDFGIVIHELVHVIQSYPDNETGWLVEGIATRFVTFGSNRAKSGRLWTPRRRTTAKATGSPPVFWIGPPRNTTKTSSPNSTPHSSKKL